jgi:hypothetical protein
LYSPTNWAGVGKVAELTGPAEIVRNKASIPSKVGSGVEMNDVVVTAKAKAKLLFDDDTTVNITEQSKLVIDDFVYDPKKGSGKLAMKVVLGTARYASGQIAKSNPQNVNVQTPTATVAVRGTDFSMTVDELGRSLIMLLPSCDKKSCVTGAIEVSTDAGSVFMDTAYQTTLVASRNTLPSKPVVVVVDPANINNLLIISPPKPQEEEKMSQSNNALDVNFLNQDFLKNFLDEDVLKYDTLGFNELDFNLLPNVLDQVNAALSSSQEVLAEQNTMLPGYNALSGLVYGVDDNDRLVLTKGGSHVAQVVVHKDASVMININQDGSALTQQVNKGGSTTITIIQK